MIPRLTFRQRRPYQHDELLSPFELVGGGRPLTITLHRDGLARLGAEEGESLAALEGLVDVPQVSVLDSSPGRFDHIAVTADAEPGLFSASVRRESGVSVSAIPALPWTEIVGELSEDCEQAGHLEQREALQHLLLAQAHISQRADLLVTASPLLIGCRSNRWIKSANPRTPKEALRITALYLRRRGQYLVAGPDSVVAKYFVNRGLYYWVLARHLLPGFWRYHALAWRVSEEVGELASSAIDRVVRALQARDGIGEQFYRPQNNDTTDTVAYHFDYLALLLAGALDAQAALAEKLYGIKQSQRWLISFRNASFRRMLQNAGANELSDVVSSEGFLSVASLLAGLRNTIHGGRPRGIHVSGEALGKDDETFMPVSSAVRKAAWDAAQRAGSVEDMGFTADVPGYLLVEPYTFSAFLLKTCFTWMNRIAKATELEKVAPLSQGESFVPRDLVWSSNVRRAILLQNSDIAD